jgi:transketolase
MAIAERMAAARFNRPGYEIVDNYTYVWRAMADFMEGVSAEALRPWPVISSSDKLIVIYDSNQDYH